MGAAVDRALAAGNVRLTMGGEPTFVSASDFDAAGMEHRRARPDQAAPRREADAAAARALGTRICLAERFRQALSGRATAALGALCALAQGRRTGVARSRPAGVAEDDVDTASAADAQRFCAALAERLQVDPSLINPAYEDVHYYLWREHRLPANVLAKDAKLADPMERARLARVFGQGLGAPVGSVLPLRRAIRDGVRVWQSAQVVLPRRRAVPAAGRFADRLSAAAGQPALGRPGRRSSTIARPIRSLRARRCRRARPSRHAAPPSWAPAPRGSVRSRRNFRWLRQGEPDLVRTALCVEPRDGDDPRVLPAALRGRGLADAGRRGRGHRRGTRPQGGAGRLPAAARSRSAAFLGHARSRRDRGQRASRVELERDRAAWRGAVRGGAPGRPGHREIHARRPSCRHRRRQPRGDGRGGTRRQSVPAPARSAEVAARLLAQPSEPVLSVQRAVHRTVQPASAHRRGAAGQPGRTGDRLLADRARARRWRPGWSIGCSAICSPT